MSTDIPSIASQQAPPFETVAKRIGEQIAAGILARIKSFPEREKLLGWRAGEMDSLPEDILWDGLGEESAPIFVVYKLIHEAFSNAPILFRSALVEFLRAQNNRFSAVFNRETIWSVMAAQPLAEHPKACPSVQKIAEFLAQAQQRGIWWRSDQEIWREAQAVHENLNAKDSRFQTGFAALQALQSEKARGLAVGNLLLLVPGRLAAYANEVVALGQMKQLPPLAELHARVDEFARDPEKDGRHIGIPLDLLYTTLDDDMLHVRTLVRANASPAERAETRLRSLYLRYFLRKAFAGYKSHQIDLKLAFYLDAPAAHISWHGTDSLFHPEEWIERPQFWQELCPGADPKHLFDTIRQAAAAKLASEKVVEKLKTHFGRTRPTSTPTRQQSLFFQ